MSYQALKRDLAKQLAQARQAEKDGQPLQATALMAEVMVLALNDRESAVYRFLQAHPAGVSRQELHSHFHSTPDDRLREALQALIALQLVKERIYAPPGSRATVRIYHPLS